ncbi:hypothetical protein ASPWEDRAFT_347920 [Aspergillus wentii DTO 134E9]|uniref:Uncharacterized protein n=1 Tax=Aspergillus wentii DTO 134E9 TaxID=1073089 RepID=A0A1L9RVP4_ASPWE|nr:uncharacterized protein ASPWEDRAFT_347920 [Aspergillus wentii DTO 134E9]OJJ38953.1 hypothetical protein ASPWEDRAFT_347920 [Aspergillus wentii DTO 134E9]
MNFSCFFRSMVFHIFLCNAPKGRRFVVLFNFRVHAGLYKAGSSKMLDNIWKRKKPRVLLTSFSRCLCSDKTQCITGGQKSVLYPKHRHISTTTGTNKGYQAFHSITGPRERRVGGCTSCCASPSSMTHRMRRCGLYVVAYHLHATSGSIFLPKETRV